MASRSPALTTTARPPPSWSAATKPASPGAGSAQSTIAPISCARGACTSPIWRSKHSAWLDPALAHEVLEGSPRVADQPLQDHLVALVRRRRTVVIEEGEEVAQGAAGRRCGVAACVVGHAGSLHERLWYNRMPAGRRSWGPAPGRSLAPHKQKVGHVSDRQPRFREVSARADFPAMDARILAFWRDNDIFHKSLSAPGPDAPLWVFYEGPPTANGKPGAHHVLSRIFKDIFPRYKTMRGYRVPRKAGWDCHGLPVELEVERRLGIDGKEQIEAYGVAEFNKMCRESVLTYLREWDRMTERIGFWIDLDDAYYTLTNDYIETVWWILRRIWDKGLLYQGFKVVPYCPRCGTAISSHEMAQGYKEVTEDSVYVRFPLKPAGAEKLTGRPGVPVSLAVWTTTPWTLVSNVAATVHPDVTYALVESRGERFVLARELVEAVLGKKAVIEAEFPGTELLGLEYEAPYHFIEPDKRAWFVVGGDYVTTTDGTGIVHTAPAFGEEDMRVGLENDLPVVNAVDLRGRFIAEVGPWAGTFVKDADPAIIADLKERGLLLGVEPYKHTVSLLLALRHAPALLLEVDLVRAHHGDQGRAPGQQRGGDVVSGAHQARALRRVAREQRRLGALARPLLGHAAAGLALRGGPHALRRFGRRAARAGHRAGAGRPRAAPALRRRRRPRLSRVRRRDAARARGHRRVVRLGLDALRAVALPLRERGRLRASASRPISSARPSTRRGAGSTACWRSPR